MSEDTKDTKELEMKALEEKLVTGVSDRVAKRVDDEFSKKYALSSDLKAFADTVEKRMNGGFGRIDAKDRKDMDILVGAYFAKEICHQKTAGIWDADTTTMGSELIPSEVATRIAEKLNTYSILRQNCTIYKDDKGQIFGEGTAATAARITTRGTAANAISPTYAAVTYATVGMQAWLAVDNKLIRESPLNAFDWVTNILVKSIAAKENVEFITGTGATGLFKGLDTLTLSNAATTTATKTTFALVELASMRKLYYSLPAGYRYSGINKAWLITSPTFMPYIEGLNAAAHEYFNPKVVPPTWYGRPCWEHSSVYATDDGSAEPIAYFGDLSYYYIFDKLGTIIKSTDQGKTAMLADATYIMAYNETYGDTPLTDAFTSLTLAAS